MLTGKQRCVSTAVIVVPYVTPGDIVDLCVSKLRNCIPVILQKLEKKKTDQTRVIIKQFAVIFISETAIGIMTAF